MAGMAEIAADCKMTVADVRAIFTSMKMRMKKGEAVSIQKFGNFRLASTKPMAGRNPQTGEVIQLPERRRVRFAVAKCFKDEVNGRVREKPLKK